MKFIFEFIAISSLLHYINASSKEDVTMIPGRIIDKQNVKPKQMAMAMDYLDLWANLQKDEDLILLGEVLEEIEGGRGKSHRYKKLTKILYPLFMGVLIAKIVLIPLILKMLTAISTAALVMGKIALIATGLLALKWMFSGWDGSTAKDYNHFELVYVPPKYDYSKPYRGLKFSGDQSWSDSNTIPNVDTNKQSYIPINTAVRYHHHHNNELPYRYYAGGRSNAAAIGSSDMGSSSKSTANVAAAAATNDLYRYYQEKYYKHNNNNNNNNNILTDGKPFL